LKFNPMGFLRAYGHRLVGAKYVRLVLSVFHAGSFLIKDFLR
jgi:hypothetical protein